MTLLYFPPKEWAEVEAVGVEGFAAALVAEGVTARARDPWEVEVEEDSNVIDAKALVTSREIARQKADVSNARCVS